MAKIKKNILTTAGIIVSLVINCYGLYIGYILRGQDFGISPNRAYPNFLFQSYYLGIIFLTLALILFTWVINRIEANKDIFFNILFAFLVEFVSFWFIYFIFNGIVYFYLSH